MAEPGCAPAVLVRNPPAHGRTLCQFVRLPIAPSLKGCDDPSLHIRNCCVGFDFGEGDLVLPKVLGNALEYAPDVSEERARSAAILRSSSPTSDEVPRVCGHN